MKSPLEPNVSLTKFDLEPGLRAYRCPKSQGVYIKLDDYLSWFRIGSKTLAITGEEAHSEERKDTRVALFCPETGGLMQRYRVRGVSSEFRIDLSPTGGIWLDAGEWDALKKVGLAANLQRIFTSGYQSEIREKARKENEASFLKNRIGADAYSEIERLAAWLKKQKEPTVILAYLRKLIDEES